MESKSVSRLALQFQRSRYAILCYHSIDDSGSLVSNTAQQLHDHLSCLVDHGYHFVSLPELVTASRDHGNREGSRLVSITFDDGYRNNLEVALPILERYNCPAIFFITTGWAATSLSRYFSHFPDLPLMTREDWQALAQHPLATLGAHSHTHPRLAELTAEQVQEELATCKHVLEEITSYTITNLSYPHGSASPMVISVARNLGFHAGCTTQSNLLGNEPLLLPRVRVRPSTTPRQLLLRVRSRWLWALYRRWLSLRGDT